MLPQAHRLKRPSDFRKVRQDGRCFANKELVLCRCRNGQPVSRFGFSVSKRVGNAVIRNRIKRVLRHIVRDALVDIGPGWDVVIIARQGIRTARTRDLARSMERLLRLSRILSSDANEVHTRGRGD